MKKFLLAIVAMFSFATAANAFTSGIDDVQPKGGVNMGLMLGVPPCDDVDAKFAMTSLDVNWTITSGMFNAGKFGNNGAIDLGLYYGFAPYENHDYDFAQHCILFRSAFHFEFFPKFDVYAGLFGGVNIFTGEDDTDSKACYGPFVGCKYFFTDHFGVKAEFGHDVYKDHNYAPAAIGLAFKF
ncbi:MAG: hypothetical protein KBT32_01585 [Bacteroidales bacterium]|nr:hypothetical protein [Candidatus Physcocola equi]